MDKRERTEKKVFSYIEEHHMIAPQDRIVVGVSGGADSVCLLFLLLEYAKKAQASLGVAHVDHGLRREAEEDARYVEALCRREGIPFFLTSADVGRTAAEERCSLEDAGRRVRYRAFARAAKEMGAGKIAVAHNGNDNAETMLFHLFRGSGLKGLCGIAPVRREQTFTLIRPILCMERREVEEYLQARRIPWRLDGTNEEDCYSRNRIRHHILPFVEGEIVAGAVGHMFRTGEVLRETEDYLAQQTEEALRKCVRKADPEAESDSGEVVCVDVEGFRSFHPALCSRMILTLMKQLSPTGKDISMVHVRDVLTLFWTEGNRSISLPFGMKARRQYDLVVFCGGSCREGGCEDGCGEEESGAEGIKPAWRLQPVEVCLEIFGQTYVYDLGSLGKIEFTGIFPKKDAEVSKNRYTKWFDYDKIEQSIAIRSRRSGDFLTIADGAGNVRHKLLKDYMITEKIPRHLRDEIPVVAAGSHVLWLAGWRVSEAFKVSRDTRRVLEVRWKRP